MLFDSPSQPPHSDSRRGDGSQGIECMRCPKPDLNPVCGCPSWQHLWPRLGSTPCYKNHTRLGFPAQGFESSCGPSKKGAILVWSDRGLFSFRKCVVEQSWCSRMASWYSHLGAHLRFIRVEKRKPCGSIGGWAWHLPWLFRYTK